MHPESTEDLNIVGQLPLASPDTVKAKYPITEPIAATVKQARSTIKNILDGTDPRLLVVVGPCSIHDPKAAMDYGERLNKLRAQVDDSLFVVMRTYFEKPRTTVGWKGLINDPFLDDSFQIEQGIEIARRLMLDLSSLGLPLATEALDPVTPQYLHDLIAWSAIGARTTESQTHREIASGLSSVVGFKNATDGRLDVAINALKSVAHPHQFLGIDETGKVSIVKTRGNSHAHIVLRGGDKGPNYNRAAITECENVLAQASLACNIMIDCSHANANKEHERQKLVVKDIKTQILDGNRSIMGIMLESHIGGGNQSLGDDRSTLTYGVSITDACIDWPTTESLLIDFAKQIGPSLLKRLPGRV